MKILKSIIICLVALLGVSSVVTAAPLSQSTGLILHVKPVSTGLEDCSSWDNACELQTALFIANPGDQVWVAAGTYKPTTSSDRTKTFQLKSGVAIYGGFPAGGGAWETRDWVNNLTTLSGDIGLPNDSNDNSYHVVTGSGVDGATILDGFTITGGNANGNSWENNHEGGGMLVSGGSPTLTNLTFSNNSAQEGGDVQLRWQSHLDQCDL